MQWLLLTGICTTHAQQHGYAITSFTPVNGLASPDITALYQDSDNYLWIAHAAGISRYDGNFENYLFSNEVRLGKTYCITEHQKGKYLIGAEAGLFLLHNKKLTHIRFKEKALPVYAIQKANNGLWIGTSDGPALLPLTILQQAINTNQISIAEFIPNAWRKHFPLTNTCEKITVNPNGSTYFSDGIAVYKLSGSSLTTVWEAGPGDAVTGITSPGNDSVYFSAVLTGLHCLENDKHTVTGEGPGSGNNVITHNGQLYYYATTGVYQLRSTAPGLQPVVLLDDNFQEWGSCVLKDNENNFWIGTHEQLLQARPKLFTSVMRSPMPGFDQVYGIGQLKNKDILIGAHHGQLFRKNVRSTTFSSEASIFSRAPVYDILETNDGDIWLGSGFQGIARYTKGKVDVFTKQQGLRDNTNLFFLYTGSGELFTGGDNGISKIITSANNTISFKNYFARTGSNNYITFRSGIEKPTGGVLFGSNAGLYELKNDSLQRVSIAGLPRQNFFITDIQLDNKGLAWISTMGDGILICSFGNNGIIKLLKQLTDSTGLAAMIYLDLLIDRDRTVWAVSHAGISRIEPNNSGEFFISNFNKTHGYLKDNYHSAKMLQDDAGTIWIATSSGIFSFDPADAVKYTSTPSIQLTKVSPGGAQLSHNANNLYFEFKSIHLSDPSTVRYIYRLVGADTNWINAGTNRSVSFRNLAPGNYRFEVKASWASNRWSDPAVYNFNITPPFWTRWWFIALLVLIALIAALALIKRRERNIRQHEAAKTELEKLKAHLATSQLTALRSQMNPHFIFNSLNAISQLVASKRNEEGLEYLSKFSRLLRLVLDSSSDDLISLKDEIRILQLYLQLESLRFGSSFAYNIHVDEQLNEEELMVPSFLVHPVVENAIWHGLLHKEGERRLIINFNKYNGALLCIIKDNGIGVNAASALKRPELNGGSSSSKGLQLVSSRLNVLKQRYGMETYLRIEDLKEAQGFISGTKVTIQLPAIYE